MRLMSVDILAGLARLVFALCAIGGASAWAQTPIAYQYDNVGRLTSVTNSSGNTAVYTYDTVGNLLSIATATPAVATPTFSPSGGPYGNSQTVTISTTTSGATIRYTTDGSVPTQTTGTVYSSAITVSATTTVRAIAYASGYSNSSLASAAYTIGSAWYDTSWGNRKAITISHSQVSGSSNLSNFPVLVSTTDAQLKSVANGGGVGNSDGSDILFTTSDGMT